MGFTVVRSLAIRAGRSRWIAFVTTALVGMTACQDPVHPREPARLAGARPLAAASNRPDSLPAPANPNEPELSAAPSSQTSSWQLEDPALGGEIEGFASAPSVNKGENIQIYVNTTSDKYSVAVFRMGWYGGAGATQIGNTDRNQRGIVQPPKVVDPVTGLTECRWNSPYVVRTQASWKSGVYLAKLTTTAGKSSYVMFVVRDDANPSPYLLQLGINTYQAYNNWGGRSLYNFNSTGGNAHKVSLNRPYALSSAPGAARGLGTAEFLVGWDYNVIRFLEREGYDVTYTTDYDVHKRPASLRTHRAIIVPGHDEYWTLAQRRAFDQARDAGVHLAFLGANNAYWQVRFEPSLNGSADRTMVGYKEDADRLDPVKDSTRTMLFRSLGLPENRLIGVMYNEGYPANDDVVIDDVSTWVTAGTGLKQGDLLRGLLGYEVDEQSEVLNPSMRRIGHSPLSAVPGKFGDMTVYTATSGAIVFATGTMQWAWGLDDFNSPAIRPALASVPAQQITRNVLNRMRNP
jgi:hypothetical protein